MSTTKAVALDLYGCSGTRYNFCCACLYADVRTELEQCLDCDTSPKPTTQWEHGNPCLCSICDDGILDTDAKGEDGHGTIYCKGHCQGWLHRGCAELTKAAVHRARTKSQLPFCCMYCELQEQRKASLEL